MKQKYNNKPLVSVIIPTNNRAKILEKCIYQLLKQDYPNERIELIVIDDGSTDNTKEILLNIQKSTNSIPIKYIFQKNRGPSSARNKGIRSANGSIIIIINDDTIAETNLISQHIHFHNKYPNNNIAVLGFFTWSQDIEITPFMYWMENGGPGFNYHEIVNRDCNWMECWTCNISYKKNFLLTNGLFDEDFYVPAWEDLELSLRLHKKGLVIKYNKDAVSYHYHPTSIENIMNKMINHGIGGSIFKEKVKNDAMLTYLYKDKFWKYFNLIDMFVFTPPVLYITKILAKFCEKRFVVHHLYTYLLLHYRIVGRRKYLKEKNVS